MDSVVLAVDRQQRLALLASFGGDQLARGYQAFLIGYTNGLPRLNGFIGGLKSSRAHERANHEVNVRMSPTPYRTRRAVDHLDLAESSLPEAHAQYICIPFGRDRED